MDVDEAAQRRGSAAAMLTTTTVYLKVSKSTTIKAMVGRLLRIGVSTNSGSSVFPSYQFYNWCASDLIWTTATEKLRTLYWVSKAFLPFLRLFAVYLTPTYE
jgi:hypothetical protein